MWRYWIPNGLVILRLIAGLCYPFATPGWRIALLIFAAVSDLIDGTISRLLNATSKFGQMADPVADKACVLAVLFTALFEGVILWWEVLLVASRDIAVIAITTVVVVINHRKLQEMPPRISGKVATAGQFTFLLCAVIFGYKSVWLTDIAILLSLWAAIDYTAMAILQAKHHRKKQNVMTENSIRENESSS